MILFFKILQFILLTFCMVPSIYVILFRLFINKKKYNSYVNNAAIITLLISIVLFILSSIYITDNHEIYNSMKYGIFYQMWNIIIGSFYICGLITMIIIFLMGFILCCILHTSDHITNNLYHIVNHAKVINISKKFHIKDKLFNYPHLYIETVYFIKHTGDNDIILTNKAYRELLKYTKKIKSKKLKNGFHYI